MKTIITSRLALSCAGILGLANAALGATNYVTTTGAGDQSGSSWANAATLSNALANAGIGDQVWMAEGIYSNGTANITNDISIYGGFTNGMNTLAERDPGAYPTVIDGAGARRCVYITGGAVLFDGMIISNGTARFEAINNDRGSGIHSPSGADLTLSNCRVVDNTYIADKVVLGIGLYASGGSVTLTNTVFAGNRATVHNKRGMGLYATGTDVSIVDCLFSNNYAYNSWQCSGGALYVNGGTLAVTNTPFVGNTLSGSNTDAWGGGAARLAGGVNYSFMNCIFNSNWVWSGSADSFGGTFSIQGSTTTGTVENCTIVQSKADKWGGAVWVKAGAMALKNCILWSNFTRTVGYDVGTGGGLANLSYNNLSGNPADDTYLFQFSGTLLKGSGLQGVDPRFASDFDDLHLKSKEGRWDPSLNAGAGGWTNDTVNNFCIDKGEPGGAVTYTNEPTPHGDRVNLGVYGNTWQASKTPTPLAPMVTNVGHGLNLNNVTITGQLVTADTIADVFIYYGKSDWAWDGYLQPTPAFQETGVSFAASKTGLDYNQMYYYRCFATNSAGTNWAGNVMTFTTGAKPPGGPAGVIHVKSDATGGETGDTWFNAFTSVADAMTAVDNPNTNEVWVAAAAYSDATVAISTNVNIYGGFDGTETNRTARDPDANLSVIDGAGARRCVYVTGGTVLFDGMIISNGTARFEAINNDRGSGVHSPNGADLTFDNCRLVNNTFIADRVVYGIGLYASGGSVTLTNTVVAGNQATVHNKRGMGLYTTGAEVSIVDCVFSTNRAYSSWQCAGGAMYVNGGTLGVTNTAFVANSLTPGTTPDTFGGGAVCLAGGVNYSFKNCAFNSNFVWSGSANTYGGTFSVQGGTTTGYVTSCTIAQSRADKYGGAIWVRAGAMVLKNSILWTNFTRDVGYDIATGGGLADLTYCSLSGDPASDTYLYESAGTLSASNGITTNDPLFASATDLHLRSSAGRWDPAAGQWVTDSGQVSPAIDAGDPTSPWEAEPIPNGDRINLGAYGNTIYASKTPQSGLVIFLR